jgi:hypothetical protein
LQLELQPRPLQGLLRQQLRLLQVRLKKLQQLLQLLPQQLLQVGHQLKM